MLEVTLRARRRLEKDNRKDQRCEGLLALAACCFRSARRYTAARRNRIARRQREVARTLATLYGVPPRHHPKKP